MKKGEAKPFSRIAFQKHCVFDERNRDTTCTDTQGDTTSRVYDNNNNITTTTDAKLKTITCIFDARDRQTSCTDRISSTTAYSYDDNNNLLTITDGEGKLTSYEYDVRNLNTKTTYPDHVASTNPGDVDYGITETSFDAAYRTSLRTDQLGDTVVSIRGTTLYIPRRQRIDQGLDRP